MDDIFLKKKGLSTSSVVKYLGYVEDFSVWLEDRDFRGVDILYRHLLEYIQYCQGLGYSSRYINERLTAVRHWYDYLVESGEIDQNPATGLQVKGVCKRLPHDILTVKELEKLYLDFPIKSTVSQRSKCIFGLFVFQGLRRIEILSLVPEDIDLERSTLFVKHQGQGRVLLLNAIQIIDLQTYLLEIRESILREKPFYSDLLFITSGKKDGRSMLSCIFKYLKLSGISLLQLRTSVITNWLKDNNLRRVQYLSGHKYISSTERYLEVMDGDLKVAVDKFHPFC